MICLITENCAGISGIVYQVPFFFVPLDCTYNRCSVHNWWCGWSSLIHNRALVGEKGARHASFCQFSDL